jgi:NADH:ubiquinone oxidoreductase subunit B-like Fe-S oxidoreductase
VLEKTGIFILATERWREKDEANWTLTNFKDHFNEADNEHLWKLTAQTSGCSVAHAASYQHVSSLATA